MISCARRLISSQARFLFLTNNSEQTPIDLRRKLEHLGIEGLKDENFITSAMATAIFLSAQKPHATCFVVGGAGLTNELYKVGFSISETWAISRRAPLLGEHQSLLTTGWD